MAKNITPMPYAMRRSLGVGCAIRTTEHKILIRANLSTKDVSGCEITFSFCSYQMREVIEIERSQFPTRFTWGVVFAERSSFDFQSHQCRILEELTCRRGYLHPNVGETRHITYESQGGPSVLPPKPGQMPAIQQSEYRGEDGYNVDDRARDF